jgi:hypothetical protein
MANFDRPCLFCANKQHSDDPFGDRSLGRAHPDLRAYKHSQLRKL